MSYDPLESILIVFQNPAEGRQVQYDDWYTNIHIRDAMRLDGAIATQRFVASPDQLVLDGRPVDAGYFAHTIYEWESAAKSVDGHSQRAATPLMEVTKDCSFENLRDFFFHPVFLSHGWTREAGFRQGDNILTAMIKPPKGGETAFTNWFVKEHVPATLDLPGFATAGLFRLHECQSMLFPCPFPMVAIYALSDREAALGAWSDRHAAGSDLDLNGHVAEAEITCWQARIVRLLAEDVVNPPPAAAAEERRARALYAGNYLTADELAALLAPA